MSGYPQDLDVALTVWTEAIARAERAERWAALWEKAERAQTGLLRDVQDALGPFVGSEFDILVRAKRILAERDEALAALDRVRALCDDRARIWLPTAECVSVADLRAALDGPGEPSGNTAAGFTIAYEQIEQAPTPLAVLYHRKCSQPVLGLSSGTTLDDLCLSARKHDCAGPGRSR